jgi:hypothetical protein
MPGIPTSSFAESVRNIARLVVSAATAGMSTAARQTPTSMSPPEPRRTNVSPAGSDSNNGTSPGSAIQTLGRVSGLQLNPGDQVLLQRGPPSPASSPWPRT